VAPRFSQVQGGTVSKAASKGSEEEKEIPGGRIVKHDNRYADKSKTFPLPEMSRQ